jgi:hypothetical protein
MRNMFVVEDERHAEQIGKFSDRELAMAELRRLATVPWDQSPNVAPCTQWAQCGRSYELIEYDTADEPWRELSRKLTLDISASGIRWL